MGVFWNKKFAAIVTGASMFAAVEFSNIYVPDKVEDKVLFRLQQLMFKFLTNVAKVGAQLNYGSETEINTRLLQLLPSFKKIRSQNVFIYDANADGVPIRIYVPLSIKDDMRPVMFYYHGGAYCFGKLDMYDSILERVCSELLIIVVSVDYRLAPKNPFPIPINDCYTATFHVLEKMNDFNINIDLNAIIFAGDSAGANAASILSTKFIKQGKYKPKLQALVYPPTQYFNFLTPSSIQYSNLEITSRAKLALIHMGLKRVNKYQEDFLIKNFHTLILNDEDLKSRYEQYLNTDLIPEEYKKNRLYYNNYADLNELVYPHQKSNEISIEKMDPKFIEMVKNLFKRNISPGLSPHEDFINQPTSLVMVCEHDTRKDEALIYAERLRLAGNDVHVQFYENGFHGVFMYENSAVSRRMRTDFIQFIRENL